MSAEISASSPREPQGPRPLLSLEVVDELPAVLSNALEWEGPVRLHPDAPPALLAGWAFARVDRLLTLVRRLAVMRSDEGMEPADIAEIVLPDVAELHQVLRVLAWHPDVVAAAQRIADDRRPNSRRAMVGAGGAGHIPDEAEDAASMGAGGG